MPLVSFSIQPSFGKGAQHHTYSSQHSWHLHLIRLDTGRCHRTPWSGTSTAAGSCTRNPCSGCTGVLEKWEVRRRGDGTSAVLGTRNATHCDLHRPEHSSQISGIYRKHPRQMSRALSLHRLPSPDNMSGCKRFGTGTRKGFITSLNTAPDSASSLPVTALPTAPFADTRRPANFPGGS